jgi:AcrR family transcriptional regulator
VNESGGAAPLVDGRQERTSRSRRAICDACLDLVQEGVLQPSADQIADRAGLSRRSIFNHFSDLAALYDAVVEAGMERCAPLLEEIPPSAPVAERVERLAAACARFFEATTPFRRSLAAGTLVGPVRSEAVRVARELIRKQRDDVAAVFAGELAGLEAAERGELTEALAAAVSPSTWEHLRASRGLSLARARAVIQRSLAALLRDAGLESKEGST